MPSVEPRVIALLRRRATLGLAVASLCLSWVLVVAPFGGADEPGHFLRSAAMLRGQLTGEPEVNPPDGILYWRTRVTLDRPWDEANTFPTCYRFRSQAPACQHSFMPVGIDPDADTAVPLDVGLYPPTPYLIPAAGTVFGPRLISLYASRLLNATACVALLAMAFAAARRRGPSGVLALMAVTTPALVFVASTVNPSGLEMSAAVAAWFLTAEFFAGSTARRSTVGQLAVALCACALARPLGPALVAVILGCCWLASGQSLRDAVKLLRNHLGASLAVAVASGFSLLWYLAKFAPPTRTRPGRRDPSRHPWPAT